MILTLGSKFKIKKEYKKSILESLHMGYENVDDSIIDGIWEITSIPKIFNCRDLSYIPMDEVMLGFTCSGFGIGISLSEVTKFKEKKIIENQTSIL